MAERMGVVALIKRRDGTVLMQHRDDKPGIVYPDHWALPGGAVEEGETPDAALDRELSEEAEYIPSSKRLLFMAPQEIRGEIVKRYVYLIEDDGTQKIVCHEGKEIRFVTPDELVGLKVFPDHVEFIERAEKVVGK